VLALAALGMTVGCGIWSIKEFYTSTIVSARNFYGVLRVQEFGDDALTLHRNLIHGTIMHGKQYLAPEFRQRPTTYYTPSSGIGRLLEALNPRLAPLKVGVIGLGAGTLAAYGAKGDVFRFYDINPDVLVVAQRDFSYLKDSAATIELPLGDARLNLEREPDQQFDVLAIDAFSSDAIPVHLITSEAVGIYLRHMKKGGVIAFHLTNRFLNLIPVVDALAKAHGLSALLISDDGSDDVLASRTDWMLLSEDEALLERPELDDYSQDIESRPDWRLWTDDFNNVVQVLK